LNVETIWLPQAKLSVVNLLGTTNAWLISKYLGKVHTGHRTQIHTHTAAAGEKPRNAQKGFDP